MKLAKKLIRKVINSCGYDVVPKQHPVLVADVRPAGIEEFVDTSGGLPLISVQKGEPKSYAQPYVFRVNNGSSTLEQEILYSPLTLLKLVKHFQFDSVLDIGSAAGGATKIFRHLGKKCTSCEISPGYDADYKQDYIDIKFPEPFDAIWCSQVLEHQRNIGLFLNKVFDDLKDDGVLALTSPQWVDKRLLFGHCNQLTPLLLIYHLVMAGFDCSRICLKCESGCMGDIHIIVRKKYNGIDRSRPNGSLPVTEATTGREIINGREWDVRELLGAEVFDGMRAAFPSEIDVRHTTTWQGTSINWGDPI